MVDLARNDGKERSPDGVRSEVDPTQMSDVEATRLGLKQYNSDTAYNDSITPNVTGTASWTLRKALFSPYQLQSGEWRLRFNIIGTSASTTGITLTVVGIDIADLGTGGNQQAGAGLGFSSGTDVYVGARSVNDVFMTSSAAETAWSISGDILLDSKPTWAY